jgi:hypothetical protein
MHLSVERLMSTVALLSLAMAIAPGLFVAGSISSQSLYSPVGEVLDDLLRVWVVNLIVIALSVDDTSLSLSIIPFLFIFPATLMVCMADSQAFLRIIGLALLTIVFAIARYIANLV